MSRKLELMVLLALAIAIFIWAARRQSVHQNTDMVAMDQYSYMEYAKGLSQTNFQFIGDRNRMPLYPGLMSLFYRANMSDEAFFELGKNLGIAIGLLVLVGAFLIFSRFAEGLDALAGTLVVMFTVFAYKAPFFQTELLFYGLSLLLFALLLTLVQRPQLRTAVTAGLVAGLCHLTKASVLPALALAVLVLILRGALELWPPRRLQTAGHAKPSAPSRVLMSGVYASALIGCFLIVIFPYIRTSKERFGHYFYNVNSTFYMWYDSWEEAKAGTRAHGDRVGWPTMPESEIPSFQKYMREHTPAEVLWRLIKGLRSLWENAVFSYGYSEFLFVYGLALALLLAQNLSLWKAVVFRPAQLSALLFALGYFLGYSLLYAWYTPIAWGNRFSLALFMPALLVILWLLRYAQRNSLDFELVGRRVPASAVSSAILLFLAAYIINILPFRISSMYGGY